MTVFRLPDLGEGLQEAEIVSWHVSEGDHVVADQPLVSVETEKAVVEIPSPQSGYVSRIHGQPGDIVAIGTELVEFTDDDNGHDAGAIVGDLPTRLSPAGPDWQGQETEPPRPAATPAVRAIATRLGVSLRGIEGTGPGGTITTHDVESAGNTGRNTISVRGVRRAMLRNMTLAGAETVPATVMDDVRIDHWATKHDTTIRLIRAIAAGVTAEPNLNAWFDSKRQELTVHDTIDLGIAMDTGDGLFVPALRDVANRNDDDLRSGIEAMKRSVSARTVPAAELRDQTFTLSNFGMLAGRHVTLVVVPPQVAILGAGRITDRAGIVSGEVRACSTLPLSLTFDHRVVTGGEATRFLAAVIADLES